MDPSAGQIRLSDMSLGGTVGLLIFEDIKFVDSQNFALKKKFQGYG